MIDDRRVGTTGRLVKNALTGIGAQIIALLVGLFTTPIIVRQLGISNYGLWCVITAVGAWMAFINMMFMTASTHYIGMARVREKMSVAAIYAVLQSWGLLVAVVMSSALFLLSGWLVNGPLNLEPDQIRLALIVLRIQALIVFLDIVMAVPRGVLSAYHRLDLFYALRTLTAIAQAVGSAVLLLGGNDLSVMAGWFCSMCALEWAASVLLARRLLAFPLWLRPRHFMRWGRKLFTYGGTLSLGYLSAQLYVPSLRLLLGLLAPMAAVTHFTIPANLARYVRTSATQIAHAMIPAAAESQGFKDPGHLRQLYLQGLRWSWIVVLPLMGLAIGFGAEFIGLWIAPELEAQVRPLMPPLLLGLTILFLSNTPAAVAQGMGAPGLWAATALFGGVCNVLCAILLIPSMGALGAGYAVLVGGTLATGSFFFLMARKLGLPLRHYLHALDLKVAAIVCICVLIMRYGFGGQVGSSWAMILYCSAGWCFMQPVIYRFLSLEERTWIRERVKKKLRIHA